MIHVSEMSWVKKVHKPSDILKAGETVEAVVLSVKQEERRIALGLKQALGDPWTCLLYTSIHLEYFEPQLLPDRQHVLRSLHAAP